MIDLFAQNGISIKTIDKSSGIIVSERTSFSNSFTWEVSKGYLNNPNAFVVVGRYDNALTKIVPKTITGDWNIRIKTVGNETVINVNLLNLYGEHIVHGTGSSSGYEYHWQKGGQLDIRSTGVFERKISDMIK
jgi:acetyltransferase-like isoleucine patch superfamily enzyme